ncbi:MAG: hypothetical protein V4617_08120 [Gemmatimonadota bacterium]
MITATAPRRARPLPLHLLVRGFRLVLPLGVVLISACSPSSATGPESDVDLPRPRLTTNMCVRTDADSDGPYVMEPRENGTCEYGYESMPWMR